MSRAISLLLLVRGTNAFVLGTTRPSAAALTHRRTSRLTGSVADVSRTLSSQLDQIRALRPAESSPQVQAALWKAAGLNPAFKLSGVVTGLPSFTRLFTHDTWAEYTGRSPAARWSEIIGTWRYSTVWAALWPLCLGWALLAFCIASLPASVLPRTSPLPLSLMGSAIGLLLVFRSNNTYQRLAEARLLWGRAIYLCREIAQSTATALFFDEDIPRKADARKAATDVCRYLAAWCWELNAKLTGPPTIRGSALYSDDIIRVLLNEEEADWLSQQRSRPLQILGSLRRVLHRQFRAGNTETTHAVHRSQSAHSPRRTRRTAR